MKIIVIGGASYDHIIHLNDLPKPEPNSHFALESYHSVGGSGIGKALNMNRIMPITFLTKFGTDIPGKKIEELLKKEEVNYIVDYDEESVTHTNLMDSNGDRVSIFTTTGNDSQVLDVKKHKVLLEEADIIILNISFFCKQYIPLLKDIEAEIWTDLHDWDGENGYHRDFIDVADVVFMSSDRAKNTYHDIAKELLMDKKFVVVTHGKDGSEYISQSQIYKKGIIPFETVDTNGAGDAYFSGFLYGYINNMPVEDCMRVGKIVSGLSVGSRNLFSDKLSVNEINRLK